MSEGKKEARARPPYLSYMVRLWAVPGDGSASSWRASVEPPLTQEQRHFQDLESLFAFLVAMTEQAGEGTSQGPPSLNGERG